MSRLSSAIVLLAACFCIQLYQAQCLEKLRDFKELLAATNRLESAELQIESYDEPEQSAQGINNGQNNQNKQSLASKRAELLYAFGREVKSAQSDKYWQDVTKHADEFKIKSFQFVEDSKKGKNWFSGFVSKVLSPAGAMKNAAKADAVLVQLAERYESQAKSAPPSQEDISCDVVKFRLRSLDSVLFVLKTDIKYLLMEEQQILNRAIFEQLRQDKFVTSTNFYEVVALNELQRSLLLQFYADRVNRDQTTVGAAVDHVQDPGEYVVGRVLDSCHALNRYQEDWQALWSEHEQSGCNGREASGLRSVNHESLGAKYEDMFHFCTHFLNAL